MSTKATFALDDAVLHEAREYVKENRLKSLSTFVERALREELLRLRQDNIRKSLLAAGNDPLFLADVMEIQQSFEHADHEAGVP